MRGLTTYVLMPLTIIGALNWGLIGIFGFDLVAFIFGPMTIASSIVYSIIGYLDVYRQTKTQQRTLNIVSKQYFHVNRPWWGVFLYD